MFSMNQIKLKHSNSCDVIRSCSFQIEDTPENKKTLSTLIDCMQVILKTGVYSPTVFYLTQPSNKQNICFDLKNEVFSIIFYVV